MKEAIRTSLKPTRLQVAFVLIASVAISAILFSHWFGECCMSEIHGIILVLLPAMLIQFALSGFDIYGVDGPFSPVQFATGTAIEFYVLLWFLRWLISRLRRSPRRAQ